MEALWLPLLCWHVINSESHIGGEESTSLSCTFKLKFNSYISNETLSCSNGSKAFWQFPGNIPQKFAKTFFSLIITVNRLVITLKVKAELLANLFSTKSKLSPSADFYPNSILLIPSHPIWSCRSKIRVQDIFEILQKLETKESSALDEILGVVFKYTNTNLCLSNLSQ